MKINPQSIDQAALAMFRDCGVCNSGGRLLYVMLQHRWRAKGFRRLDLPVSLHRLKSRGLIRFEQDPDFGLDIVLLPEGQRRLNSIPLRPLQILRHWRNRLQVLAASWRLPAQADAPLRRRAVDHLDAWHDGTADPPHA